MRWVFACLGLACCLVFLRAFQHEKPTATYAAATSVRWQPHLQPLSLKPLAVASSADPAQPAMQTYSREPLDPLQLTRPVPEIAGPTKVLFVILGIVLLPIVAIVFLYQKLFNKGLPGGAEDPVFDHRINMSAVAAVLEGAAAPGEVRCGGSFDTIRLPKAQGSKRRRALDSLYTPRQLYPAEEALRLVKEAATANFVEGVDVAVNLGVDPRKSDQMVRGSVVLPQGTGRVVRVAAFCHAGSGGGPDAVEAAKAAGAEFCGLQDLADLVKGGELGFDIVVATPDAMRVALQLGKVLGPRGLMPNPKDGTVDADIARAVRTAKAGQVKYRADKAGIVHCPIGKSDFDVARLKANLDAVLRELVRAKPAAVKGVYVKKVVVTSSMGPGICVDLASTEAWR